MAHARCSHEAIGCSRTRARGHRPSRHSRGEYGAGCSPAWHQARLTPSRIGDALELRRRGWRYSRVARRPSSDEPTSANAGRAQCATDEEAGHHAREVADADDGQARELVAGAMTRITLYEVSN